MLPYVEILMSLLTLLTLKFVFISVFFSLLLPILCKVCKAPKVSPHGPPTYPIIGCLISFHKNRHRLLDWYTELLADSATNTIVLNRLGAPRTIVTANSKNVEYVLKTNFSNFPKGKPFTEILGDFLGYGIFNVDGELWRMQRKLVSHVIGSGCSSEFMVRALKDEVENQLLPLLESLADTSKVVDLQELLKRLAFNMICKVSLGVDRCCLDPSQPVSALNKAFDTASEISAKRGAAPLFLVWKVKKWVGVGSEKRLKDAAEEVRAYVEGIIRDKKIKMDESGDNHGEENLLSRLIIAGNDEEAIRDMTISFIMAGRDTTSAAMTWFFWLLSCHPAIEQELVKEINTVEKTSLLDYESLKGLKLLKASLCESMRLYPPVAWDSKHAMVDDLLPDGTPVRAADRVTYFPYGMGRMEALWGKDWHEFRPSRWFTEPTSYHGGSLKKVCPFKYPVFQAGPRVCLGKEMAFIQMNYVVASILRQFEIKHFVSEKPVFVPLLTAHMAGGLKVEIQKRDIQDNIRI
ncbi:Cytochrome P450 94B1 [Hibiscus syriacus]|uniref:Cytochrome P450 94B1 n=1 Tax=Hibiscus syriacus TaxID=106335 RepID=A0A6A3BNV7_HIBSY|nr:cytochrome P450 94B1-like [Hibiscus syriacus]KAE8717108.1 Cytochrome P450 94B1 [Hibiscus syriacus]